MSCIQLIALQWRLVVVACYLLLRRRYHIASPVWLCAVRPSVCLSVRTSRDNRVLPTATAVSLRYQGTFFALWAGSIYCRQHQHVLVTGMYVYVPPWYVTYLPDTYAATTSLCCCSQRVDELDNNSRRFLICIYVHCVSKTSPMRHSVHSFNFQLIES